MIRATSGLSGLIGSLATRALVAEATLAPKPGLVTPLSKGAHTDMDYSMFVSSALALEPCFEACAFAGESAAHRTDVSIHPTALLDTLRGIGQEGERAMYRATGGINTHKGAIFSLGLLSAALAFAQSRRASTSNGKGMLGDAACAFVAEMCSGLVERELCQQSPSALHSAGERLYRDLGVRGARGQAQDGFPLLTAKILPLLRRGCGKGSKHLHAACLDALLLSMSELEDSCLLSRGGLKGLEIARRGAAGVLQAGDSAAGGRMKALRELDASMSRKGLSPGGSADMVAAGIFLVSAEMDIGMMQLAIAPRLVERQTA